MAKPNEEDLDKLISRIRDGDCVLFLGPGLFLNKDNSSIYSAFSKEKCAQMTTAGIAYDEAQADNINYTVNRYIKKLNEQERKEGRIESTSGTKEKKAFASLLEKSLKENEMYAKLAQLPFFLTINTNPDDQIYKLQQAKGGQRKYHFWYYDFMKANNEPLAQQELPVEINADNFVVYNVYGHAGKGRQSSILVGESEFVNFTQKVNLPSNGMPAVIKNFIKNDKVCLFLGFEYNSWPLKILLQALGFTAEVPKQNISFLYDGLSRYQADFYSDEMKFLFIDFNADQFIDELFTRFNENNDQAVVMKQPDTPLLGVFISKVDLPNDDQKEDLRIREKIAAQLKSQEMKGYIKFWSEDLKIATDNLPELINEKFESADIFILLGSGTVFDDDVRPKMEKAIQLADKDPRKVLVPVYVRYFMYEPIAGIPPQSWIPKANNIPIPIIDVQGNEDKKCMEVCEFIKKLIPEILSKRDNG